MALAKDPSSRSRRIQEARSSATSTTSSGPSGPHFEGQVAASYLLAMLCGAPPRGLPGTSIDRISLQQSNTGFPLDDIVVHAFDAQGKAATLEVQVKRTLKFTRSDTEFTKVVGQIAKASNLPGFWERRHELAIAIGKTSQKIDGAYQDVLAMARQIDGAASFYKQLEIGGNDDKRTFVAAFEQNLRAAGLAGDPQATHRLLSRLQILTFDFTATGSASADLLRERALAFLHDEDAPKVDGFLSALVEQSLLMAQQGGEHGRDKYLELLQPLGFRFAGRRRHASARAVLAEQATQALESIDNAVGRVVISRQERLAEVRNALDIGRYVELRGEGGVGKSGVLRQLAETLQKEGQVIVVDPLRCVRGGWTAMASRIGFDGKLHELMVELANDGGATLFIDNLDGFDVEQRATVNDLVRAAARVPGVSIVTTARKPFDEYEESWLPSRVLEEMPRAPAIEVDPLTASEIAQIVDGDASLERLLRDDHPASKVTRNLFRLARLAKRPSTDPLPRTEAEMARQWWTSADGSKDEGHLDRSRLLIGVVPQVLSGTEALDVSKFPVAPINALIRSGTLRQQDANTASFRHDVLREWSIAGALQADSQTISLLDLTKPATAVLARGVDLAARMFAENPNGGPEWKAFLKRLSGEGVHRSWRRAALLAPVRSEAATASVRHLQPVLFEERAELLRELLRTVLAVDATKFSDIFSKMGVDSRLIPGDITVPWSAASFVLALWLVEIGDGAPAEAVPEIVDLYRGLSIATLGMTPLTPRINQQLYRWLRSLEPEHGLPGAEQSPRFQEFLGREQLHSLVEDLRTAFAMFADKTPDLAKEYLAAVAASPHSERLIETLMQIPGRLPQAAPAEMAQLTELALTRKPSPHRSASSDFDDRAFTFFDSHFNPPSPAQGPFLELLQSSPADGLRLIRRLVGHAISHHTRGRTPGTDAIEVRFEKATRRFSWQRSYFWSRQSPSQCVTSALMALEAWAHLRVDSGESFAAVLDDVLGPPDSCAAYLLVAVDLILSHWPQSKESCSPFLTCPELLCLDHTRQAQDSLDYYNAIGAASFRPEPSGPVRLADLNKRPSRRMALDSYIGACVLSSDAAQTQALTELLQAAVDRLGPPAAQDDLGDPRFMAQSALNQADPVNWPETEMQLEDGTTRTVRQYCSPPSEREHLQALRAAAESKTSDDEMQASIRLSITESRFSPDQLRAAVDWARQKSSQNPAIPEDRLGETEQSMLREAVVAAAMMVMRDGDPDLKANQWEWAHATLVKAVSEDRSDPVHHGREGLLYNPIATAYAGLIHSLGHDRQADRVRAVLTIAAEGHFAAAAGFGVAIGELQQLDDRVPQAILRCAFSSCVRPSRRWDARDEERASRREQELAVAKAAVDAEMDWLSAGAAEPAWTEFPARPPRRKQRLRLPMVGDVEDIDIDSASTAPSVEVYHQTAALWLRQVLFLPSGDGALSWLQTFSGYYLEWTLQANGMGLGEHEEVDGAPSEWNRAFLSVVARASLGMSATEAERLVAPVASLPERNFYNALVDLLDGVDRTYFGNLGSELAAAVAIRDVMATRMTKSQGWRRLRGQPDLRIEINLAPAIAVLFFSNYGSVFPTRCYLNERGLARLSPFLPTLTELVVDGPCLMVAFVLLNLLEVSPRHEHLDLLSVAARTWLSSYPDFRPFWIDHGVGRRWCKLIATLYARHAAAIEANPALRADISRTLAELVAMGIPEANHVEEQLAGGPSR